jgi:two-component system, chemotaxis family, CheB/CheR fusion protein
MSDQTSSETEIVSAGDSRNDESSSAVSFPIVGVGASAGGLAAFGKFLSSLPTTTGMAFVLVQHLAPQHESQLVQLLTKETRLPVTEARDGLRVEPNHVYVIPPNVDLALTQGVLHLTPRAETHGPHLSIDYFMRSLAHDRTSRAIGVVLSGTGSDGTLGLAEIKAAGGITFAQDPASAESPEMPASAITAGAVDFVLTPTEIAQELVAISRHAYLRSNPTSHDVDPFPADQANYAAALAVLKNSSHIDFTLYRDTTIKRRMLRRMAVRGIPRLADYVQRLAGDAAEIKVLLKDVLINVTSFFRDRVVFDAVRTLVFPRLTKEHAGDEAIRIWVVACSTGQEAYSLAIELTEHLEREAHRRPLQIFATDISESSLNIARAGVYPASIEAEVSPERLRRHFSRVAEGYRINKSLRDLCVFAKHDVTADTPFSKIDVISCRNVLIYLTPTLQARVIPTFCYTLNPGGFLILGSSETIGRSTDMFNAIDPKNRVYMKNSGACRIHPPVLPASTRLSDDPTPIITRPPTLIDLQRAADRIVINRYAPAGVLVDSNLNILQFRGKTAAFLEPAQGQASLNLLKMVPHGLAQELASAINEAKKQNITVRRKGVRVRDGQHLREIDVEISLVRLPGSTEPVMLILFEEGSLPAPLLSQEPLPTLRVDRLGNSGSIPDAGEFAQLKQELAAANDYQQSLIEENNAINDELRYAHDEAVSGNEELRCTNEELQTAKEEVESANEELATLNEELRSRNQELSLLSNDLTNLLDGIDLPVVMLDGELRLRRISGPTADALHLSATDLGRQIRGLELGFTGARLDETADEVMRTRTTKEVEVRNRSGRWYALRVTPYRTEGDVIAGAVATYIDIDVVKRSQESLRLSGNAAKAIIETVRDPLLVLDATLRVETANRAFIRVFGLPQETILGQHLYDLGDGAWDIEDLRRLLSGILVGSGAMDDFEVTHDFPRIGRRTMLLNARLLEDGVAGVRMIVLAIADITEQKRITDALKVTSLELERSNTELKQFASLASHDLQEPLRTIRSFATLLQERLGDKLVGKDQEFMTYVVNGAQRMQEMITAILYYSEVGHQGIRATTIDLRMIAHTAVANLENKITKANASVAVEHLPSVTADPLLLTQLLQNLVSNGVKFRSKDRLPVITISSRDDGHEWVIIVADNGIGVRNQDRTRIFGLFQRAHSSAEYPGTGIGLATCKKIAERHGGRLWLESTLDVGTTFFFSLPKVAHVEPEASEAQSLPHSTI